MDNLRLNYNLLFKSFLEQYHIFLQIDIFIEKIINSFYYYKKKNSIEYSELINMLNIIILDKYKSIEQNEYLISKLKDLYKEIKNASFLKDFMKEDTLNVYFILFNQKDEIDLNVAKYSINNRRKNHFVYIGRSNSHKKNKIKKNTLDNILKRNHIFIYLILQKKK